MYLHTPNKIQNGSTVWQKYNSNMTSLYPLPLEGKEKYFIISSSMSNPNPNPHPSFLYVRPFICLFHSRAQSKNENRITKTHTWIKYCSWECVMNLIRGYLKVKVTMDMILSMSAYITWVKNLRLTILQFIKKKIPGIFGKWFIENKPTP